MAVTRMQVAMIVIFTMFVLHLTGVFGILGITRGFSPAEGLVSLLALVPIAVIVGIVWFGMEILSTLRRIETAVQGNHNSEPEFFHGS